MQSAEEVLYAVVGPPAHWFSVQVSLSFFFNVYLLLRRETEHERGRGEKEGDTEPETVSRLWAVSTARCRAQTHELWDHDLSQSWMLNQLSHQGAPSNCFIVHEFQFHTYLWKKKSSVLRCESPIDLADGLCGPSFNLQGSTDNVSVCLTVCVHQTCGHGFSWTSWDAPSFHWPF